MAFGKMVSLELHDEDKLDHSIGITTPAGVEKLTPDFPWGTRISLTEKELGKLGLDCEDCDVGDYIEFLARARVKNKSASENESGDKSERVELQIEEMCCCDEPDGDDGEGR